MGEGVCLFCDAMYEVVSKTPIFGVTEGRGGQQSSKFDVTSLMDALKNLTALALKCQQLRFLIFFPCPILLSSLPLWGGPYPIRVPLLTWLTSNQRLVLHHRLSCKAGTLVDCRAGCSVA